MKYAIHLLYDNGQGAYLDICLQLLAKDRFLRGVVAIELERDFFALPLARLHNADILTSETHRFLTHS